jgi:hypothetical protein
VPDEARRAALLRDGAVRVAAGFGTSAARALARDPLLAVAGGPDRAGVGAWIGFERSVRGIESAAPAPLSGVWLALLAGAG